MGVGREDEAHTAFAQQITERSRRIRIIQPPTGDSAGVDLDDLAGCGNDIRRLL